jgi:hypothetical protein
MPTSSNINNYFVGKGVLYFTKSGDQERELGNAPSVRFSPNTERLDHFSSQSGIRSKDRSILLEKVLTCTITLDEITPDNLAMFFFGDDATTNTDGNSVFSIFAESEVTGSLRLVGTNDVGNKFEVTCPSVSVTPTGEFDFISDEFGTLEMTIEILLGDDGTFGTIEQTDAASTT